MTRSLESLMRSIGRDDPRSGVNPYEHEPDGSEPCLYTGAPIRECDCRGCAAERDAVDLPIL